MKRCSAVTPVHCVPLRLWNHQLSTVQWVLFFTVYSVPFPWNGHEKKEKKMLTLHRKEFASVVGPKVDKHWSKREVLPKWHLLLTFSVSFCLSICRHNIYAFAVKIICQNAVQTSTVWTAFTLRNALNEMPQLQSLKESDSLSNLMVSSFEMPLEHQCKEAWS